MVSSSVKRVSLDLEMRRSLPGPEDVVSGAGVASHVGSYLGAAVGVACDEIETEDLIDVGAESIAEDGAVELVPKLKEPKEACAVPWLCWLEVDAAEDATAE